MDWLGWAIQLYLNKKLNKQALIHQLNEIKNDLTSRLEDVNQFLQIATSDKPEDQLRIEIEDQSNNLFPR